MCHLNKLEAVRNISFLSVILQLYIGTILEINRNRTLVYMNFILTFPPGTPIYK